MNHTVNVSMKVLPDPSAVIIILKEVLYQVKMSNRFITGSAHAGTQSDQTPVLNSTAANRNAFLSCDDYMCV